MPASDVYAWAKASTKPSYTYSEVGAVPQRTRTNWHSDDASLGSVVGQLAWKNNGNGHTIFDASAGTSPDGTAIDLYDADIGWSPGCPTLMGWDGTNTYGVRVESAENAYSLMGYTISVGRNDVANKVVITDSNGYIQAGWINTTSGDNGTTAISRIYASSDGYIRYYTPANFISTLNLVKGDDARLSDARTPLSHGHGLATQLLNGFMSAADKTKLDLMNSFFDYRRCYLVANATTTAVSLRKQKCYIKMTLTDSLTGVAAGSGTSTSIDLDNRTRGATYEMLLEPIDSQWNLTRIYNNRDWTGSINVSFTIASDAILLNVTPSVNCTAFFQIMYL